VLCNETLLSEESLMLSDVSVVEQIAFVFRALRLYETIHPSREESR